MFMNPLSCTTTSSAIKPAWELEVDVHDLTFYFNLVVNIQFYFHPCNVTLEIDIGFTKRLSRLIFTFLIFLKNVQVRI